MNKINNSITSNRRGQTLVIALMVMMVLAMVATLFIALVARNLFRSGRFADTDEATQIAEAGIRYADKMLVSSEDGADWRPTPDNRYIDNKPCWPDTQPHVTTGWYDKASKDPDFKWTMAYWPTELRDGDNVYAGPTGGYTTFNTGDGRFLLRVSYNPDPSDPMSKYIKIESVGRIGVYDTNDPTTGKPNGDVKLKRELTAYKPIGITDYIRFVTNKDDRTADFPLGCPGYDVKIGRDTSDWVRGAPLRVNGNLLLYGGAVSGSSTNPIDIYLRGVTVDGTPTPIDRLEIAGDLKFGQADEAVNLYEINTNGSTLHDVYSILQSSDDKFTTANGFVRDSNEESSDAQRRVKRIEPPDVNEADNSNTTTRYRLLTLNSGDNIQDPSNSDKWINTGRYGWGRGIYIDNFRDVQNDSETIFGGYNVHSDWMNPNNAQSRWWVGPYYEPPAVVITLLPDKKIDDQYYFAITRTDTDVEGNKKIWYDAWGNQRSDWGQTILMPYPDAKNGRKFESGIYNPPAGNNKENDITIGGNGVIYAEGNIRIRGMLPPDTQLTVVSNENIYIDGNLLKYRNPNNSVSDDDQYRGADNTCGLALLARQNICVNTTQFFAPENGVDANQVDSGTENGELPTVVVNNSSDSRLKCGFEFGPWESASGTKPAAWRLYLRHSGQDGPSYINAWLNTGENEPGSGTTIPDNGILSLAGDSDYGLNIGDTGSPLPSTWQKWVWGVGDPRFGSNGQGVGSAFTGDVFKLDNSINAYLYTNPGGYNTLTLALDQTTFTRNNYSMGGLAVQPFDVRIEAVMYAQEGSFYVLPGNWFNSNKSDTYSARGSSVDGVRKMFPCYGQPLDIRIIIDGAVSENIPAPMSDVEEWMSKWGKIPEYYGTSAIRTAHPGEGLTFLYDDHVGWPLKNLNSTSDKTPIRCDEYGRALPIAPRLPVSSSLIYFGDIVM